MTDKLISDLGSIGAAIADNTATEVQRSGQTTTEQALASDWKTYIKSWIAKADVGLGSVVNSDTTTQANVVFTGLSAAAAAADADTFPTNQGAGNLKQTLAAIKTWIKSWIAKADVGLGSVVNSDTTTQANVVFTGLSAAAAAADADTFPTNQGAGNLKQTFAAVKTWIKSWIAKADVGLGSVANSLQLVAASNLSDLANAATARANLGAGKIVHPGYKASNWYVPLGFSSNTISTSNLVLGNIYLLPFFVSQKITLSDLAANLITAQAASNCQLAIYNSNPSDPTRAGTLVGATGSIVTTATGNKTATFSGAATFQLDIGWYFFAVNSDVSALVFSCPGGTSFFPNQILGSATLGNMLGAGGNSNFMQLSVAQAFGTWPDLTAAAFVETLAFMRSPLPAFKVASVP